MEWSWASNKTNTNFNKPSDKPLFKIKYLKIFCTTFMGQNIVFVMNIKVLSKFSQIMNAFSCISKNFQFRFMAVEFLKYDTNRQTDILTDTYRHRQLILSFIIVWRISKTVIYTKVRFSNVPKKNRRYYLHRKNNKN